MPPQYTRFEFVCSVRNHDMPWRIIDSISFDFGDTFSVDHSQIGVPSDSF